MPAGLRAAVAGVVAGVLTLGTAAGIFAHGGGGGHGGGGHGGGGHYGGAHYGGAHYGGAHYGGAHYGGAHYGGAHYGGAHYGGAHYGGAHYGGAHYGGAHFSAGHFGGFNSFGGAHVAGLYGGHYGGHVGTWNGAHTWNGHVVNQFVGHSGAWNTGHGWDHGHYWGADRFRNFYGGYGGYGGYGFSPWYDYGSDWWPGYYAYYGGYPYDYGYYGSYPDSGYYGDYYGGYPYDEGNYAGAAPPDIGPYTAGEPPVPNEPPAATKEGPSESEYYSEALAAFKNGDYQNAVRLAGHATLEQPRNQKTHLLLMLGLFAAGQYRPAAMEAHAVAALGEMPDWPTVYAIYGNVETYTWQVRALEKFRAQNPLAVEGRFLVGFLYAVDGHKAAAQAELLAALKAVPQDTVAAKLLTIEGGQVPPDIARIQKESKRPPGSDNRPSEK